MFSAYKKQNIALLHNFPPYSSIEEGDQGCLSDESGCVVLFHGNDRPSRQAGPTQTVKCLHLEKKKKENQINLWKKFFQTFVLNM